VSGFPNAELYSAVSNRLGDIDMQGALAWQENTHLFNLIAELFRPVCKKIGA